MRPDDILVSAEEVAALAIGINDRIIPVTQRGKYLKPRTVWKAFRQGRLHVTRSSLGYARVELIPQPNRRRVQDTETGKWIEIPLAPDEKGYYPITEEAYAILSAAPKPPPRNGSNVDIDNDEDET